MCHQDTSEGPDVRKDGGFAPRSGKGDVSGADCPDPGGRRLRTGVLCPWSPVRELQRAVLSFRSSLRKERQQGRMHPGLPVAVRPGRRKGQGPGEEQGSALPQGLQPSDQAVRPCRGRCQFVQDRGQAEEHHLCPECREGIFTGAGRARADASRPLPEGILRQGDRRFCPGSGKDFQPGIHRAVPGREKRFLVLHGCS